MTVQSPVKTISRIACALLLISASQFLNGMSNNSRHDPYPVFSTLDPHIFLQLRERDELKGFPTYWNRREWFAFSISPFGQNADNGKDRCQNVAELGDISGRWGMIGLLMGATPQGQTFPEALEEARAVLFRGYNGEDSLDDLFVPAAIDKKQEFGFFKVPLQYRKRGVRFDVYSKFTNDFGVNVKFGVSDIRQRLATQCKVEETDTPTEYTTGCETTVTDCGFVDMTGKTTVCIDADQGLDNLTTESVQDLLMCRLETIVDEIHLDISEFHETGVEDVRAGLYWRHAFLFNRESENPCWEEFLLIPFALFEGSVASFGKQRNRQKAFALSFGNDDHEAIGFTGGINIDFAETIEIGCQAGFTHFFDRSFCNVPMPTSELQSSIFPFSTDVNVQPGNNWQFGAKLAARHFIGCLSVYAQYMLINHDQDCYRLKNADPAFKPKVLSDRSDWRSQLANVGFNYDISNTISLGVLWQAPLAQMNCYRSSTLMASFNAIF